MPDDTACQPTESEKSWAPASATLATTSRRKKVQHRRWRWAAIVVVCLLVLDYWAYPYGVLPSGRRFNTGENGLWLRYTWYMGRHTTAETRALAERLQQRQIRYAYFHVRHIKRDGSLAYRCARPARTLVDIIHRNAPGVRILAWIYAGNEGSAGNVHLDNPAIRVRMVEQAVWLVHKCGFDGIQWDYETCPDGDASFLKLLRQTRAALPAGTMLSVATPLWLPGILVHWGWSDRYFEQVAAACDQMAVMCYDSGFYLPRSYVWLVAQQAVHVTQDAAQANAHCRVLLGVPTYGTGLPSHNPRAENIRLALLGVRQGLANSRSTLSSFAGVAPFADYTTSDADWIIYQRWWLR